MSVSSRANSRLVSSTTRPSRTTRRVRRSRWTPPMSSGETVAGGVVAQSGSNPCQQLFEGERLAHVVVRAGFQAQGGIPLREAGEHDHRHPPSCGPNGPQHRESVPSGEPHVEDDEVDLPGDGSGLGPGCGGGDDRDVAGSPQSLVDERGDPWVVLDDEDPGHGAPTRPGSGSVPAPAPASGSARCLRVVQGNDDGERGAQPRQSVDDDPPAVGLRDEPHDRQAQTRALGTGSGLPHRGRTARRGRRRPGGPPRCPAPTAATRMPSPSCRPRWCPPGRCA